MWVAAALRRWVQWAAELREVGLDRHCAPHHRMPFDSSNKGLKRMSIKWRVIFARS